MSVALLTGCRSDATIAGGRYTGPEMRLEDGARDQVVVVDAPSPGWDVAYDHSRVGPGYSELFVTMRRPDPRFFYPQVMVQQHIATDVANGTDAKVYARTLGATERRSDAPYRLAAERSDASESRKPAETAPQNR